MIDNTTWGQLKAMFLEILSWAGNTILFNLTVNNVSVKLSILDFGFGLVAFELIIGVVWAVLNRGGGSSDD